MNSKKQDEIEVGNIITVIHKDWAFTGKQGVVVEIEEDDNPDGPIGVKFPSWYWKNFELSYPFEAENIIRFERENLKKEKEFNLTQEDFMKLSIGKEFWESRIPKMPLVPGDTDCMHEGCKKKAFFEIWVNIWGIVYAFHVCGEHAHYHGKRIEEFPVKTRKEVTV